MSKRKKSNNYLKNNKNKNNKNVVASSNNTYELDDDAKKEISEIKNETEGLFIDENILEKGNTIVINNSSDVKKEEDTNLNNINNIEDTSKENKENEESKLEEKTPEIQDNKKQEKDKQEENKKEKIKKIEIEESIDTKELKVIGKRNFFTLLVKFIFLMILSIFRAIGNVFKKAFIYIKDFFEDEAEELDRKIREIKDEEVIKNKKRNLDYEKYNTKRIYKDLERAEKYKERANRRVNTERYFEDEIEKEKINSTVLVSRDIDDKSENKINNLNKKNRIEKKKNEILELRKRRKEQRAEKRKKTKEEKNKKQEEKKRIDELADSIKAEEERIIKETEELVKSMEEQLKLNENATGDDDYNCLFSNEFGTENDLDTSSMNKEEKKDKIKNRLDEIFKSSENNEELKKDLSPKEEKDDIVATIDSKTKSDILRYIDVSEKEIYDNFEEDTEEKNKEKDKESKKNSSLEEIKQENDSLFEVASPSKVRVSENQDGFKKALLNIEKNNIAHNEEIIYGKHNNDEDTYENKNTYVNYDRKFKPQENNERNTENQTIVVNSEKLEELEEIKNAPNKEKNKKDKKKHKKNIKFLDKIEKKSKQNKDNVNEKIESNEEERKEISEDNTREKGKKVNLFESMKKNINEKIKVQKEKYEKKKNEKLETKQNINENENKESNDVLKEKGPLQAKSDKENILDKKRKEKLCKKKKDFGKEHIKNEDKKIIFNLRKNTKNIKKNNEKFEFNEEEYTNRFIKNIIGVQDFELEKNNLNVNNSFKNDEIVMNVNGNVLKNNYNLHEKNSYEDLMERTQKEVKNKPTRKSRENNDKEENMNAKEAIKNIMSAANLKFSEVTAKARRKKERKNRIKRNQIYSTSYNKRNKRK